MLVASMAVGEVLALRGCHVGVQYAPAGATGSGFPGKVSRSRQWRRGGRIVAMSAQKTNKLRQAEKLIHEFRQSSATPLPLLHQVADDLVHEMYVGLAREGGSDQLKMLPTFVQRLPSGYVSSPISAFPFSS